MTENHENGQAPKPAPPSAPSALESVLGQLQALQQTGPDVRDLMVEDRLEIARLRKSLTLAVEALQASDLQIKELQGQLSNPGTPAVAPADIQVEAVAAEGKPE